MEGVSGSQRGASFSSLSLLLLFCFAWKREYLRGILSRLLRSSHNHEVDAGFPSSNFQALVDSVPLLKDPDPSMREMATSEISSLRSSLSTLLSTTLPTLLLPPSSESELSCIVELKSGAGGDEAALFAWELMQMYIRYASLQGWKVSVLEESKMGVGEGLRDAQLEIKGAGAYGKLRWESGVHRVQRVPATEKAGRTHTSTMAIIVSEGTFVALKI